MWSNDHPAASGLETLAAFAAGSGAAELELGVARDRPRPQPAGRRSTPRSTSCGLDRDRLWIGVGAGFSKKPLTTMREALRRAARDDPRRHAWSSPRWARRCARWPAAAYDGAFFNWMTPGFAAERARARRGGRRRGGPRDAAASSATCAPPVGADAETRLAKEEGFYRDLLLGEPVSGVGSDGGAHIAEHGRSLAAGLARRPPPRARAHPARSPGVIQLKKTPS